VGAGGRNEPSLVCTYEFKKKAVLTKEKRKHNDLGFLALPYVVFPPYCNNPRS
jgi:hypothetical protein